MKYKIMQAGCFILYAAFIYLWIVYGLWYLAAALFLLHLTELIIIGYKVGKQAEKSTIQTVFMVLLCGFTWWLPLKK